MSANTSAPRRSQTGRPIVAFATITAPRLDGGNDLRALANLLGTFSPVAPPSTVRVNELP